MSERDWFVNAFGAAVDDIRKRLVEEPWFGREVTPPHQDKANDLGWTIPEKSPASDQGPDFDR